MKLLGVEIKSEFYKFQKINPMKQGFAIFFSDFALKIKVKC